MGMFSWECKGCGAELCSPEIVRMNGCVGPYDGYGRAGDYTYSGYDEPIAWHEACYQAATDKEKLDEIPSEYGENQGFGAPQEKFMEDA